MSMLAPHTDRLVPPQIASQLRCCPPRRIRLSKSVAKRRACRRRRDGGIIGQKTNPVDLPNLLRARRERPRRRRAAEQRDELAASHVEHGGSLPGAAADHISWNRRMQAV
jgi:hypothetical protein